MQLSPEQKAAIEEQKQYCPFCKIIKGEIPASKYYEDAHCIAILDINPATNGHTLLIPKEHYPVFPFLPEKERNHIATLLPKLGAAMEAALLTSGADFFIANGAAAGQQTSHLLLHLFPSDKPRFKPQLTPSERGPILKQALAAKFASPKDRLATLLSSNAQVRELLVERPKEFAEQLKSVPDLAALFAGVDLSALSKQLSDSQTPRAKFMEDEALVHFVKSKSKLHELLFGDLETLTAAVESQPKLQRFFEGSTPEAVAERVKALEGGADHV